MAQRLESIVSGKVQMVMYRDFVQRKASGLKLLGEVQNLRDGTVRVIAEGEHDALVKLLEKLYVGSILSRVEGVAATWTNAKNNYHDFSINYGK
jgi:acylphosphatase